MQNGQATPRGSDIGLYQDTPTRTKIDLAGAWSYSFDEERWGEVRIPAAFDYEGRIVFLRKFPVSDSLLTNCTFSLVAYGINYEAELFVNDIFIGKHTGASSFEIDIPEDVIQKGEENAVKIVVTNALSSRSTLPLRKQVWGWRNYAGIYRDIFILATPRVWVRSLAVSARPDPDGRSGSVRVKAVISNLRHGPIATPDTSDRRKPLLKHQFLLQVFDPEKQAVVTQAAPYDLSLEDGRDAEVTVVFPVAFPRLWSPESPAVLQIRAFIAEGDGRRQAILDESRTDFGFVRVTVSGTDLLVNGKKTTVRGVVWHEDSPDHGSALTYDQMERDVALIKSLGANAIRFAFRPPHPWMINLCNRYGLLAFVEMPAWYVPGEILGDEIFQTLAEGFAREMVSRDGNSPSIAAWGIGNEFDSSDPRSRVYVQRIVSVIRGADERPVYFGSIMPGRDGAADLVDFVAIPLNSRDVQDAKDVMAAWKKDFAGKPVFVLEYGRIVETGNRNGYSDPLSEEAQARFLMQMHGAIREAGLAGSFIRAFADWRGDRPLLTVEQEDLYLHPVGLVTSGREKRLSYEVMKTTFAGQRVAALPIGKYRSAFPVVHVVAGFIIIFAVAYQYHYNRRFNESFKRSLLRSYNFFADLRDVRTVSVFHTFLVTLMISLTLGVVLSSLLYHFRMDVTADQVITHLLVWDNVKEYVIRATWNPLEGILALTVVFLAISVVLSILVRITSLFLRAKIHWLHSYTVIVWASVPLVFLSPLGMSLFKILQNPFYVIPSFLLLTVFAVWVIARTLKGISVILDLNPVRTSVGGILVLAASAALIVFYYDSEFQITAYAQFLINRMAGG